MNNYLSLPVASTALLSKAVTIFDESLFMIALNECLVFGQCFCVVLSVVSSFAMILLGRGIWLIKVHCLLMSCVFLRFASLPCGPLS